MFIFLEDGPWIYFNWLSFNTKLFFINVVGPSHGSALTWYMRMKIALDTARYEIVFPFVYLFFSFKFCVLFQLSFSIYPLTYWPILTRGLEYLHEHCNPSVIHRDLKTSNILLDANFNAKVSNCIKLAENLISFIKILTFCFKILIL